MVYLQIFGSFIKETLLLQRTDVLVACSPTGCQKWQFFWTLDRVGVGGAPAGCQIWRKQYNNEINLYMKSSTIGPWVILFLSMNWFGTLRLTLALIMCGSSFSSSTALNFGFGCISKGEQHVTASPSGTSSNISYSTHWFSHFFNGSRRY